MIPTVIQVFPTEEYKVYVYFSDGQIRFFDMSSIVGKGVFKAIEDIDVFMGKCTVLCDTLAWDLSGTFDETKCLDIDPISIYEKGIPVEDPLTQEKLG